MAILPAVPGITIVVLIDDTPTREYRPPCPPLPIDLNGGHDLPTTGCFIESQAEKAYEIGYRVSPNFFPDDTDLLILSIFIDGVLLDEWAVLKTQLNGRDYINKISYFQRDLPDSSPELYSMVFERLTMEEADQATTNADLQRIKTLGTIKVVVGVAKGATQLQKAPSFDDGKKNESLALSQKALVLDNHERGHGTSYRKIDDNRVFDSPPLLTPDTQYLGCFFFFYRPHDFFEAWNLLDPSFIKHEVHGMQQPTQGSRASIVPAGSTVIDLTGEQPMGQS